MALKMTVRAVTERGPLFLGSVGYSQHLNRKLPEALSPISRLPPLLEPTRMLGKVDFFLLCE